MKKNNNKKRITSTILVCLLILSFGILVLDTIFSDKNKAENISYGEVVSFIKEGEVSEIVAYQNSSEILITLKDETKRSAVVPNMDEFSAFISEKIENGLQIEFTFETKTINFFTMLRAIFEGVVMGVGIATLCVLISLKILFKSVANLFKKNDKPSKSSDKDEEDEEDDDDEIEEEIQKSLDEIKDLFSKVKGDGTQFKPVQSEVKFSDVAGIDEEKAQLEEVVKFLKDPQKYHSKGARIPKGILLNGAPGTGKTLLAKAIAGEAGVPFFQANGSSFEEKYVGVGASRVRELFKSAKEMAPSLIFIDEIDSVAQSRYNTKSYSEQTLNQLLAEMDGFDTKDNVIVIAATNHMDVLDEALIRPGRFDRHIFVPMPDVLAREKILKVHAKNKYFSEEVSLAEIARKTVGFSGADLENVLNEAAIYAVNLGSGVITNTAVDEAIARVLVGLAKKNSAMTEEDKYLTAVHEAGHAIISALVRPEVKNFGISIVPRGNAGGYNFFDESNKTYHRKEDLFEQIQVLYGGRIAEDLVFGDISTGASSDLEKATKIAYQMITRFAMSGSLITQIPKAADFNNQLASNQMAEIEKVCRDAYDKAYDILKENKHYLMKLTNLLMKKEYLPQEEVESFIAENFNMD